MSYREDKRREVDSVFNDAMKKMEGYGEMTSITREKSRQSINGRDYQEKIRDAQKVACQAIEWKLQDNRKRGRQYLDGKTF